MKKTSLFLSALSLNYCRAFTISSTNSVTVPYKKSEINMSTLPSDSSSSSKPIAIMVDAEIKPDRLNEFLDIIQRDAIGSRAEPGCIRFDVIQNQENPCKFFFYEVYQDADAVKFHKEQPHFALWTDFKASGGVVSSVSHKCDGLFLTE